MVYLDYEPSDDEAIEPHCDLCGRHMEANGPYRLYADNDWNGETGNHISCEENREWRIIHEPEKVEAQ